MLTFAEDLSMLATENMLLFDQHEDMNLIPQNDFMVENPDFNMIQTHVPVAQPMVEHMAVSPMSTTSGASSFSPSNETFLDLEPYFYQDQGSPCSVSTGISEQDIAEAYELVMENVLSEIGPRLGIPQDPIQWTQDQVQSWIALLIQEYGRPTVNLANFQLPGCNLCTMSQDELELRAPENGYFLHSNLTCLKNIPKDDVKPIITQYQHQQQQYPLPPPEQQPMSYAAPVMYPEQYSVPSMGATSPVHCTQERETAASPLSSSSDEDETYRSSPVPSPPTGPNTFMTPHHTGTIQLWQFLQELLNQPDSYNYCIRFLDRVNGIFKIEDSVEVARLWGLRKNRPAMNYDKLSRSIRQYYRKNIMKKTEISQRLVYQFITPF